MGQSEYLFHVNLVIATIVLIAFITLLAVICLIIPVIRVVFVIEFHEDLHITLLQIIEVVSLTLLVTHAKSSWFSLPLFFLTLSYGYYTAVALEDVTLEHEINPLNEAAFNELSIVLFNLVKHFYALFWLHVLLDSLYDVSQK
jgi:hypothetical protein